MANAFGFVVATSPSRHGALNGSALPQKPLHSPSAGRPFPKPFIRRYAHDAKSHAPLIAKASGANPSTKSNSIVCANCDGNGAIQCTQCNGNGINAVDHFGGRYKAGQMCWLCRGKREILCGNCNGAGFIGGFMSTFDE
ncbi:hypothetical protein Taro_005832 [Colocasia esculenta]|uniref:BSD2 cysteine rich domain-containing protein n=1 Tax=Colocasia esculenta TaxID=4460 RepID=A0A843TVS4_COLES|nr:hypothetical protein [Colocasia esculenta]